MSRVRGKEWLRWIVLYCRLINVYLYVIGKSMVVKVMLFNKLTNTLRRWLMFSRESGCINHFQISTLSLCIITIYTILHLNIIILSLTVNTMWLKALLAQDRLMDKFYMTSTNLTSRLGEYWVSGVHFYTSDARTCYIKNV